MAVAFNNLAASYQYEGDYASAEQLLDRAWQIVGAKLTTRISLFHQNTDSQANRRQTTKFLYEVTNTVKDGRAVPGVWDTSQLPKGDYVLRIIAADYSGNEAQ